MTDGTIDGRSRPPTPPTTPSGEFYDDPINDPPPPPKIEEHEELEAITDEPITVADKIEGCLDGITERLQWIIDNDPTGGDLAAAAKGVVPSLEALDATFQHHYPEES